MDYELAEKLRDAGFPQDATELILRKYSLAKEPIRFMRPPKGTELGVLSGKLEWEIAFPTLTELIEACGDDFLEMGRHWDGYRKRWTVGSISGNTKWGDTPEIAIANLWLSLQDNKCK
jgi:hypothetical protein